MKAKPPLNRWSSVADALVRLDDDAAAMVESPATGSASLLIDDALPAFDVVISEAIVVAADASGTHEARGLDFCASARHCSRGGEVLERNHRVA
jgi:hypothetical protein